MKEIYDIAERLKQLRTNRNLSQSQAAAYLDVNRATISSYENNVALPSADMLAKLAVLYRTTSDYILGINNRPCIVLDGLTDTQQTAILNITEAIITEFKAMNRQQK